MNLLRVNINMMFTHNMFVVIAVIESSNLFTIHDRVENIAQIGRTKLA